jgi:hypothetical protein
MPTRRKSAQAAAREWSSGGCSISRKKKANDFYSFTSPFCTIIGLMKVFISVYK